MRRKLTTIFGVAVAFVALAILAPVGAQQDGSVGGSGLQISPPRTDTTLGAGEQREVTISVTNVTQGDLTARTSINDFESDNETGNPRLLVNTDERTPYSLANMISGLEDFDLNSGETKEIAITISVPADATPGAYFSAVRFAAVPKTDDDPAGTDGDQQVALTASVAHLLLIEVPGEINEQIQLESLKFRRDNTDIRFPWTAPNQTALSINNLGNGFSRPFGKITISRGGAEIYSYEVNDTEPKGVVLPQSSRTFVNNVENISAPGKYVATALVAYGNGGEVLKFENSFWYIPLWSIAAAVVLIGALAIGGRKIYGKKPGSKPAANKKRSK